MLDLIRLRPLTQLGRYLGEARPIQTSSQVIAEIYFLVKKRWNFRRQTIDPFWRLARQEFEQLELADHFVTMAEMDHEDFVKYGPADASILRLAIRLDAAVLTCDRALGNRCVEREITILDYDRVVSLQKDVAPSG